MDDFHPKVTAFINSASQWQPEYWKLREIILGCGLTEDFKWRVPCYTFDERNIVLIHGFKDYCAILFPKGALLNDLDGILIQQTENVQAARQVRFKNLEEIEKLESVLKAYIKQAVEVEKTGREIEFKQTFEFKMPDEFQEILSQNPTYKSAFEKLTPGRQHGYLLYFSSPKQSATRTARIKKSEERILAGKGIND